MADALGSSSDHFRLITKFASITELTSSEKLALCSLPLVFKSFPKDQDVIQDNDVVDRCCLLVDGFVHRYKMLPDGDRQIMSIHLPGDILDLQSLHIRRMDHSIGTLTKTRVAYIAHAALLDLAREHPGIAVAFWRDTLIDAAIFREWIVNVGRRDAYQRLAHLFCELHARMRALGLAEDGGFAMPLTQSQLADATGLTVVHVNRTLKSLRASGLIGMQGRFVHILDRHGLEQAAGFDSAYLHFNPG